MAPAGRGEGAPLRPRRLRLPAADPALPGQPRHLLHHGHVLQRSRAAGGAGRGRTVGGASLLGGESSGVAAFIGLFDVFFDIFFDIRLHRVLRRLLQDGVACWSFVPGTSSDNFVIVISQ